MARPLKIIAGIVGVIVLLFAILVIAVSLLFDPNDYREDIAKAVYEETGRELAIEGDISLSVFPWLALELGKTSLSDSENFGGGEFFSFESASFAVELMPAIFDEEIIVSSADITGLDLNLKVDARGNSNWTDFPEPTAEEVAQDAEVQAVVEQHAEPSDLDIGRVELVNARISYADAAAAQPVILSELNVGIGGLAGRERIEIDGFSIDGVVEGVAAIPTVMSVSTDEIVVDTTESVMSLAPIVVEILGMRINAAVEPFSYAGNPTPTATIEIESFSPRSVMTQFEVEPPETADPTALSAISIKATAQVTPSVIAMSDVTFVLDDTTFTGALSVPLGEGGEYRFDLNGDAIDVGRYMAPASETAEPVEGDAVPVEIPVDLIRPLRARGNASLQRATLGKIVFENIQLGLNADNGQLRLHPISSDLFGGAYNGDVRINASGSVPQLSVNERVENVDVGQLAVAMFDAQNVTGKVNGLFRLNGSGNTSLEVQQTLAGDIALDISNGAFQGTDIWWELRRARAVIKGEQPPEQTLPAKTDFTAASFSGAVNDGVVRNADLRADLPFMQLTGTGTVDLVSATLDYALQARVLDKPEFMGDVSAEELNDFTSTVIPLRITGPLASPSVQPDMEKLLRDRVEDEIKDRLKDKLGDLFN